MLKRILIVSAIVISAGAVMADPVVAETYKNASRGGQMTGKPTGNVETYRENSETSSKKHTGMMKREGVMSDERRDDSMAGMKRRGIESDRLESSTEKRSMSQANTRQGGYDASAYNSDDVKLGDDME